jgi:hypothetical protein
VEAAAADAGDVRHPNVCVFLVNWPNLQEIFGKKGLITRKNRANPS